MTAGQATVRPGTDRRDRFVVGTFERTAQQLLGYLGIDSPADLVPPVAAVAGAA